MHLGLAGARANKKTFLIRRRQTPWRLIDDDARITVLADRTVQSARTVSPEPVQLVVVV